MCEAPSGPFRQWCPSPSPAGDELHPQSLIPSMPPLGATNRLSAATKGPSSGQRPAAAIACQSSRPARGPSAAKTGEPWRALPPSASSGSARAGGACGISHPLAHDGYLINLASPERRFWRDSVAEFIAELGRAEALGIPFVVAHPGAYTTGSEKTGLRRVARALDEIHAQTRGLAVRCLLETTAGQGSRLGWRFEHFAAILDRLREPDRLGFCFDTCHVFAAGYPLSPPKIAIGPRWRPSTGCWDCVASRPFTSTTASAGRQPHRPPRPYRPGQLGLDRFRLLLNDPRFQRIPMYLETPKDNKGGKDWDAVNLRTLRKLL